MKLYKLIMLNMFPPIISFSLAPCITLSVCTILYFNGLILREEHRLRLSEKMLLTKVILPDTGSKRGPEKTGTLQKIFLG